MAGWPQTVEAPEAQVATPERTLHAEDFYRGLQFLYMYMLLFPCSACDVAGKDRSPMSDGLDGFCNM